MRCASNETLNNWNFFFLYIQRTSSWQITDYWYTLKNWYIELLNILHILLGSKSGTWSTLGHLTVQYKGKTLQKIVAHDNSNDKAENVSIWNKIYLSYYRNYEIKKTTLSILLVIVVNEEIVN